MLKLVFSMVKTCVLSKALVILKISLDFVFRRSIMPMFAGWFCVKHLKYMINFDKLYLVRSF